MGGSSIDRTSVLPLLWDMVELDYTPADAYVDMGELFTDGTKSLIDAMAAGLDVRFGTVVTRVVARRRTASRSRSRTAPTVRAGAADRRAAAERVGRRRLRSAAGGSRSAGRRRSGTRARSRRCSRWSPTRPTPTWARDGARRSTPGSSRRPAGDDRLFMGFSVQDRVDLSDHDAVAAAVNAHLPEATVVGDRRPRLGAATRTRRARGWRCHRPGSATARSRRSREPEGRARVRGLGHRRRGRRLDRGRDRERRRRGGARPHHAQDNGSGVAFGRAVQPRQSEPSLRSRRGSSTGCTGPRRRAPTRRGPTTTV